MRFSSLLLLFASVAGAQTPWIINWSGQSLAMGYHGDPPLTTSQPYSNVQLTLDVNGVYARFSPLIPLVENRQAVAGLGTTEMPLSAAANNLTALSGGSQVVIGNNNGLNGAAMTALQKGSTAYNVTYAATTGQLAVIHGIQPSAVCKATAFTHGEANFTSNTTGASYESSLVQYQSDMDADCKLQTGQSSTTPLYIDQFSCWGFYDYATPTVSNLGVTPGVPMGQLRAFIDNPSSVIMVGPKYHLPTHEGLHLSPDGYRRLGELYGKVYKKTLVDGVHWIPLMPIGITQTSSTTIAVQTHLPGGTSLVIDTTTVANRGNCKGFEPLDSGGSILTCTSAVTVSGDTATITVASAAAVARVRYAYTGATGAGAGNCGAAGAPAGNIRDNDSTLALSGHNIYDWMVTFDLPVGWTFNPFPVGTAPTITSSSPLTAGTVGSAYSQTLTATGDTPITWTCCVTGSLPAWASLSSGGVITGTPNALGTSTFTVTATNGVSPDDTKSLGLTINPVSAGALVIGNTRVIGGVTFH